MLPDILTVLELFIPKHSGCNLNSFISCRKQLDRNKEEQLEGEKQKEQALLETTNRLQQEAYNKRIHDMIYNIDLPSTLEQRFVASLRMKKILQYCNYKTIIIVSKKSAVFYDV